MPKKGDLDLCRYCNRRITYGPYYFRKGKAAKRWTHEEGMRSCLTKPKGWFRKWPKAKPGGSYFPPGSFRRADRFGGGR